MMYARSGEEAGATKKLRPFLFFFFCPLYSPTSGKGVLRSSSTLFEHIEISHASRPTTISFLAKSVSEPAGGSGGRREPVRRRLSVLGATMLLVAAMMVASAPPLFAKDGGCHNRQEEDWIKALVKHDNDKQTSRHLEKLIDCALD
jgi:hypothetical protein